MPQLPDSQEPKTWLGKLINEILENLWEALDLIGRRLMGELWRNVVLTVQETIALIILLKLPDWISRWLAGKEYSGFDVCFNENPWSINYYACYAIVLSGFLVWIGIFGIIFGRLVQYLSSLAKKRKGKNHGSK